MRTTLFLAAFMAVSTFSSVALAKDVDGPATGSACDVMSKAFIKETGGKGDRVRVIISEERDGGVSFLTGGKAKDFPIGELNGQLPHLVDQAQAIQYGNSAGAWAVLRKQDDRMKVFYAAPDGCKEAVFAQ